MPLAERRVGLEPCNFWNPRGHARVARSSGETRVRFSEPWDPNGLSAGLLLVEIVFPFQISVLNHLKQEP